MYSTRLRMGESTTCTLLFALVHLTPPITAHHYYAYYVPQPCCCLEIAHEYVGASASAETVGMEELRASVGLCTAWQHGSLPFV